MPRTERNTPTQKEWRGLRRSNCGAGEALAFDTGDGCYRILFDDIDRCSMILNRTNIRIDSRAAGYLRADTSCGVRALSFYGVQKFDDAARRLAYNGIRVLVFAKGEDGSWSVTRKVS